MDRSLASSRARSAALGVAGALAIAGGVAAGGALPAVVLSAAGGVALCLAVAAGRLLGDERSRARAPSPVQRPPAPVPAPAPAPPADRGAEGSGPAAAAAERATVAAVAHDMSNPLATLKANLEWLRDALDEGRLSGGPNDSEAREVLRDAREATERLRADVGALREVGRGNGVPPPPDQR